MSFLPSCKIIFKLFLININNNIRCLGEFRGHKVGIGGINFYLN